MTGALDHDVLERCLNDMVERHAALRTTFTVDNGEAVQVVTPFACENLRVHDLSVLPEEERDVRPFDLATGPVLRYRLVRLGPAEHVLVLTMHHIAGGRVVVGCADR